MTTKAIVFCVLEFKSNARTIRIVSKCHCQTVYVFVCLMPRMCVSLALYLKAILMILVWIVKIVSLLHRPTNSNKSVTHFPDSILLLCLDLLWWWSFVCVCECYGCRMHLASIAELNWKFLLFCHSSRSKHREMGNRYIYINKARNYWTVNSNQFHNNMSKYKRRLIVRTILCQHTAMNCGNRFSPSLSRSVSFFMEKCLYKIHNASTIWFVCWCL